MRRPGGVWRKKAEPTGERQAESKRLCSSFGPRSGSPRIAWRKGQRSRVQIRRRTSDTDDASRPQASQSAALLVGLSVIERRKEGLRTSSYECAYKSAVAL